MSISDYPSMLFSESRGWSDVDHAHRSYRWYQLSVVLPMSVLPPLFYVYAELSHPGAIFPVTVPALSSMELLATGVVFYLAQVAMVSFMAMMIQRLAIARDHDPGYDGAYALAAIAPIPLWLGSLALAVPSLAFNLVVGLLAIVAAMTLIRHGTKPLLHVEDEKKAHYIADVVILAGIAAWVGVVLVSGMVLGGVLSQRFI